MKRVTPPPATIIRSRYVCLSSATNRSRLSICLTESGSDDEGSVIGCGLCIRILSLSALDRVSLVPLPAKN
ncbi:hypothetical protein J6590_053125 [Homalodisca vitripennis]|nr:hypothetical protein J6590_053125 [Homalodisca vitripennis]